MPKNERMNRGWLKIGELAKKLGVPVTTIRYYTEIGLLPVIAETPGGYRLYDEVEAFHRFLIVRQMNSDRPTLRETKEIIERSEVNEKVEVEN
jgi:DNA-binding transcriptional MerR regulator